jgi:N6-adenosine-specific RNA methylase IME4
LRPKDWPFGDVLEPWSYGLIFADPPWRFQLWSEKGEGKSAQAHYATMTIEEIAALPVWELAAPDCLLWLWCTAPMLPQQLEVLKAWRFEYVTMGAWAKRTKHDKSAFGGGYVLRSALEPFLIGKRGDPETTRSVRNVVVGPVREHSRKPDEAYAAAEKLMPGARRVELFARQQRPNWASWGNEVGKFNEKEAA